MTTRTTTLVRCLTFALRTLTIPANSRFYPLDNSYGHTLAGNPLESTDVLTSHFNDTDFTTGKQFLAAQQLMVLQLGSSSGRFYVNSVITCDSGAALRLNFEAGVIKIGYHFVIKLEVLWAIVRALRLNPHPLQRTKWKHNHNKRNANVR